MPFRFLCYDFKMFTWSSLLLFYYCCCFVNMYMWVKKIHRFTYFSQYQLIMVQGRHLPPGCVQDLQFFPVSSSCHSGHAGQTRREAVH